MIAGKQEKEFVYRCLMRPPAPGAVPIKGLRDMDFNEGRTLTGHYFWGTVVYANELTSEEVRHYDLEYVP